MEPNMEAQCHLLVGNPLLNRYKLFYYLLIIIHPAHVHLVFCFCWLLAAGLVPSDYIFAVCYPESVFCCVLRCWFCLQKYASICTQPAVCINDNFGYAVHMAGCIYSVMYIVILCCVGYCFFYRQVAMATCRY